MFPRAITVLALSPPLAALQLRRTFRFFHSFRLVTCGIMTFPPLFFPDHYFIGCQLIVLLINITISDALWIRIALHCTQCHICK